jgi:endonuclease YncB( thermonuclease family)
MTRIRSSGRPTRWAWILALVWIATALPAAAAAPTRAVEGMVSFVVDGDSLWLAPADGGAPLEVRLQDIDAPEICQPWGAEAREALRELVLGKTVRLQVSGRDVHGRTLATLYLGELNVNQALVKEGQAWSGRYKHDRGRYVAEERMAKALGRGFNRAGGAVMPRDFRRDHGPCVPAEAARSPASAAAAAPVAAGAAVAVSPTAATEPYRCDGRIYCSQMRSCAEATYFLKNCPGVKMDGDRDGVPCEQQWCRP